VNSDIMGIIEETSEIGGTRLICLGMPAA